MSKTALLTWSFNFPSTSTSQRNNWFRRVSGPDDSTSIGLKMCAYMLSTPALLLCLVSVMSMPCIKRCLSKSPKYSGWKAFLAYMYQYWTIRALCIRTRHHLALWISWLCVCCCEDPDNDVIDTLCDKKANKHFFSDRVLCAGGINDLWTTPTRGTQTFNPRRRHTAVRNAS